MVDPLDGTINFLFGIPQWCVSVAVRDEEGTLAGAVYDPNRDELFSATRGRAGATARRRRERCAAELGGAGRGAPAGAPRARMELASAMVATGLAYERRGARRPGEGARSG